MPRGWGAIGTGQLIRIYMLARWEHFRKGASQYRTYSFIVDYLEDSFRAPGYVPPTYDSIRAMWYILHKPLGIIEQLDPGPGSSVVSLAARPPPNMRTIKPKTFWGIVKGKENALEWKNPYLAYAARRDVKQQEHWNAVKEIPRAPIDEQAITEYAIGWMDDYDNPNLYQPTTTRRRPRLPAPELAE